MNIDYVLAIVMIIVAVLLIIASIIYACIDRTEASFILFTIAFTCVYVSVCLVLTGAKKEQHEKEQQVYILYEKGYNIYLNGQETELEDIDLSECKVTIDTENKKIILMSKNGW